MEVASAIFVEASWCRVRLPEPQGGRRSRELDDRSSCHQTASRRDNSLHCTDGEAGEAIHRAASSLARLFCLGKETTHAETMLRQREQFGTTKFQGCNTVLGYPRMPIRASTGSQFNFQSWTLQLCGLGQLTLLFLIQSLQMEWGPLHRSIGITQTQSAPDKSWYQPETGGMPLSPPHNSHQAIKPNIVQ